MLVAEYDYDLDIEVQREEAMGIGYEKGLSAGLVKGRSEGRCEGQLEMRIQKVRQKFVKGLSPEQIAGQLEEDIFFVQMVQNIFALYPYEDDDFFYNKIKHTQL